MGDFMSGKLIEFIKKLLAKEKEFITEDEKEMLEGVNSMSNTTAKEVMVPRPDMIFISTRMTNNEIFDLVLKHGFSRYPVYENDIDDVIGVLYIKDLVNWFVDKAKNHSHLNFKFYLEFTRSLMNSKHALNRVEHLCKDSWLSLIPSKEDMIIKKEFDRLGNKKLGSTETFKALFEELQKTLIHVLNDLKDVPGGFQKIHLHINRLPPEIPEELENIFTKALKDENLTQDSTARECFTLLYEQVKENHILLFVVKMLYEYVDSIPSNKELELQKFLLNFKENRFSKINKDLSFLEKVDQDLLHLEGSQVKLLDKINEMLNLLNFKEILGELKNLNYDENLRFYKKSLIEEFKDNITVFYENTTKIKSLLEKGIPKEYNLKVEEIIKREVYFIPESTKINQVLKEMQSKKVHIAMLLDEYGGISGALSLEDILEEIVGDIQDEFDNENAEIIQMDDKNYIVLSKTDIDDVNDMLKTNFPVDEFDTIGGFIFNLFARIPKANEKINYNENGTNVDFEILEIVKNRMKKIKITINHLTKEEEDD